MNNLIGFLGVIKALTVVDDNCVTILLVPPKMPNNGITCCAKGAMAEMCKKELKEGSFCAVQCVLEQNEVKGYDLIVNKLSFIKE